MQTYIPKQMLFQTKTAMKHSQQGASVSGVVFFILMLGLLLKLAVAILPAQISNYQLNKTIAEELKKANQSKSTPKEFMSNLTSQLNINGDYSTKPEEVLVFTSTQKGNLTVRTHYQVANNFFNNVDIVNRFEQDITMADAQ